VPDPGEWLFDFDEINASGGRALEHGLPALPEELIPPMVIPLVCWKTPSFGAVFFLTLLTPESDSESPVGHWHGIYERIDEGWSPRGFTGGADRVLLGPTLLPLAGLRLPSCLNPPARSGAKRCFGARAVTAANLLG
jgi:hypothetical protein